MTQKMGSRTRRGDDAPQVLRRKRGGEEGRKADTQKTAGRSRSASGMRQDAEKEQHDERRR